MLTDRQHNYFRCKKMKKKLNREIDTNIIKIYFGDEEYAKDLTVIESSSHQPNQAAVAITRRGVWGAKSSKLWYGKFQSLPT